MIVRFFCQCARADNGRAIVTAEAVRAYHSVVKIGRCPGCKHMACGTIRAAIESEMGIAGAGCICAVVAAFASGAADISVIKWGSPSRV